MGDAGDEVAKQVGDLAHSLTSRERTRIQPRLHAPRVLHNHR